MADLHLTFSDIGAAGVLLLCLAGQNYCTTEARKQEMTPLGWARVRPKLPQTRRSRSCCPRVTLPCRLRLGGPRRPERRQLLRSLRQVLGRIERPPIHSLGQ